MTVSTPYFDLVFEANELRAQRIVGLTNNIANAEQRIELLESKPLTARRARRIARLEAKNSSRLERIDAIEDEIIAYNAILPKDEFTPSFWVDDDGKNYGVSVTVTDSPYDDTYVGGTELDMSVSGRGYYNGSGFSGFNRTLGGLMADEYAPVDDTKTVGFTLDPLRLNGAYPELSVSMRDSDSRDVVWSEQLITDGVQLI